MSENANIHLCKFCLNIFLCLWQVKLRKIVSTFSQPTVRDRETDSFLTTFSPHLQNTFIIPIYHIQIFDAVIAFIQSMSGLCFFLTSSSTFALMSSHSQTANFGPRLLTWFTCISNYIHYKVCDEIMFQFPNFNDGVEVWEWINNFISHFTWRLTTYPCWD